MAKNRTHRYAGPTPHRLSNQEVVQRIQRNGITLNDLKRNFDEGYAAGKKDGTAWGFDCLLGSMALALHREFGWGPQRIQRVVDAAAMIQIQEFTTQDVLDKLVSEAGLSLPMLRDIANSGGI